MTYPKQTSESDTPPAQPRISVCIPTYNRAQLLPAAIDSALMQLRSSDELLILDNHSTDDTTGVLGRYTDPRLRVVRNDMTVSMYENHNRCVTHARGDWILFLHSDDVLTREALAICHHHVAQRPQICCLHPCEDYPHPPLPATLAGPAGLVVLFRMRNGTPSGKLYSRAWLLRIPFPREPLTADQLLLGRILAAGGTIERIEEKLVHVNEGDFQTTLAWVASGQVVRDFAIIYDEMIDYPGVLEEIGRNIATWSDYEVADALMFLAHAGRRKEIAFLEKQLRGHREYRQRKGYRHVKIYKILGLAGLRWAFGTIKILKNLKKAGPKKNASATAGGKSDSGDNPIAKRGAAGHND